MVRRVTGDVFGELLETGKAVVKQAKQVSPAKIAKTAANQLTGSTSDGKGKGIQEKGLQAGVKPNGIKDALPELVDPKKMTELQQKEAFQKEKGLSQARSGLERIKIQRYQKLQQEILTEEKKKEQEIRAYEAGKPGAARTHEEKAKLIAEQRKKQEEEKGKAIAPPTSKQPRGMGIFGKVKSKKGTKELGKKTIG